MEVRFITSVGAAIAVGLVVVGGVACGDDGFDEDEARREIIANFERFFDSETPQEEAFTLAEDIDEIGEALTAAAEAFPLPGRRTVEVGDVTFTSETSADVAFAILVAGEVLLPDVDGNAVLEDGVWKVGRKTNCDLAALAGTACPVEAEPES